MANQNSDIRAGMTLDTTAFMAKLKTAVKATQRGMTAVATATKKTLAPMEDMAKGMRKAGDAGGKSFKSLARIIQGILISQAFYKLIGVIQDTISEIGRLGRSFETAYVSFSLLLKSQGQATRLLADLEHFAARTPLELEETQRAAQRLLAVGFKAKELIPTLTGIVDAISLSGGNADTLQRITQAIGNIKTSGTITRREVNTLTRAAIPAMEILSQELGLTASQVRDIGDQAIPAKVALDALFAGIQKRYGGAADVIAETADGLRSTLKDNFFLIAKDLTAGFRVAEKNILRSVGGTLEKIRTAFKEGGAIGLVEAISTPETAPLIKSIIQGLQIFVTLLRSMAKALQPVAKLFGKSLLTAMAAILPVLNAIVAAFAYVLQTITQAEGAVKILVHALTILWTTAFVYKILLLVGAAIKALSFASVAARAIGQLSIAIRGMFVALTSHPIVALITAAVAALLYLLLQSQKVRDGLAKVMGDISGIFGATSFIETGGAGQALEDYGDSATDAANKTEKAAKKMKKSLLAFDEVFTLQENAQSGAGVPGVGNIDGIVLPTVDDEKFLESLKESLGKGQDITNNWLDDWVKEVNLQLLEMAFATKTWGDTTGDTLLQTAETMWDGINAFYGDITTGIWDWVHESIAASAEWEKGFWQDIGDGLANSWESFKTWISDTTLGTKVWAEETGGTITTWAASSGGVVGAWASEVGAKIGAWAKNTGKDFSTWAINVGEDISEWSSNVGSSISTWSRDSWEAISTWTSNTATQFSTWVTDVSTKFSAWSTETGENLEEWASGVKDTFKEWATTTGTKVTNWKTKVGNTISTWSTQTNNKIGVWSTNTKTKISAWATTTGAKFDTWSTGVKTSIQDWSNKVSTKVGAWSTNTKGKISTWATKTKENFSNWSTNTKGKISTWASNTGTTIGTWSKGTFGNISNWAKDTGTKISNWAIGSKTQVNNWSTQTWTRLKEWGTDTKASLGDSIRGWRDKIREWTDPLSNAFAAPAIKIQQWWDGLVGGITGSIDKLKNLFSNLKFPTIKLPSFGGGGDPTGGVPKPRIGHARGGVFNKEHVANFSEGNKMEAILPVQNPGAMAEVRRAIFGGDFSDIMASAFADALDTSTTGTSRNDRTPIFVNNLIANERALKELARQLNIINLKEEQRGGAGSFDVVTS